MQQATLGLEWGVAELSSESCSLSIASWDFSSAVVKRSGIADAGWVNSGRRSVGLAAVPAAASLLRPPACVTTPSGGWR
jgi:hypothetical protein